MSGQGSQTKFSPLLLFMDLYFERDTLELLLGYEYGVDTVSFYSLNVKNVLQMEPLCWKSMV